MVLDWQRRRILVWGKTRPEVSRTYRETVCTGGVFEDTRSLVRLYPIPLRYLDDAKVFKKYQWIEADVARAPSDARPESYRIRPENITPLNSIPTKRGNWDERARWVLDPKNLFQSVEGLQRRQKVDNTSLGLVQPKEVLAVRAARISSNEREAYWERYREIASQIELPMRDDRPIKPLTPPTYRFQIEFRCDDSACAKSHLFSVLDWEADALYGDQVSQGRSPEVAAQKVVERIQEVCGPSKDTRFFLGNISTHPQVFTIVGFWWPARKSQSAPTADLFDLLDQDS